MPLFTRTNSKVHNDDYIRTANNPDEEVTKPAESEKPETSEGE
jgi:hypothetical protein